ncbi:MAG: sodium-dependent bicarbonate transport family permease [Melioribacteraceae bacterium]|nr:sodium-dependent bicarbonate transport family permease [Melioribacteraceae bacterium]
MNEIILNGFSNLNTPAILFFLLGFIASVIRSDIKIPDSIVKILSIYLMISIGYKGGYEIYHNGISSDLFKSVLISFLLGFLSTLIVFFIVYKLLKKDSVNAGAIAAHYGSVSVVTFITAISFLEKIGVEYKGYIVGMLALMESPAILIALILVRLFDKKTINFDPSAFKEIIKEALFNGSIVLLFGSLIIGFINGAKGFNLISPFFVTPFQGVLTLFLLEMGMIAGKRIEEFKKVGAKLGSLAVLFPIVNGIFGVSISTFFGLDIGTSTLFGVLTASSSYIAAPAAVRLALPEANPTFYITMSLAITFPFNIILGIPLYFSYANLLQKFLG